MIKAIQSIYDVEKKEMEQIRLTKEAALTAGYNTKSNWFIEEARQDKEEIDMCEAMERYTQRKVEEVMDYLDISQEEQRLMNE